LPTITEKGGFVYQYLAKVTMTDPYATDALRKGEGVHISVALYVKYRRKSESTFSPETQINDQLEWKALQGLSPDSSSNDLFVRILSKLKA
jgi:hypothetical protein